MATTITDRHRPRLSQKQLREQLRALRRQQARKARAARRQIHRIHQQLPKPVRAVFDPLAPAFTRPTHRRFILLALAALLTLGRHTIANLLRCLGALAPGHPSSYHRVFSRDRWSSWTLARGFAHMVLARFVPEGPILLAGDDTVEEHPGKHVFGKGCHRDPVRSTHSFTAYRWGHKWVAVTVLVPLPFTTRRWALPLLIALYQPEEQDRRQKRRHKTPSQFLRQMLRVLLRWFPDRTFVCTADGNYATHELAELTLQYPRRLTFVSRFYPKANLVAPPPPYAGKGRPRVKGDDRPSPAEVVQSRPTRQPLEVAWYGGGRRRVEVVTGSGCWYQSGRKLVPVCWVFVHDLTGTHRDEYFFATDLTMSPREVIETYTGRWNIETTFQELRAYLGLETTRGWSRNTVLRAAPCLFGLYTVVVLLYVDLPARYRRVQVVDWPGKGDVTFSDAITAVRRWLWVEWVFALPGYRDAFSKLDRRFRQIILNGLAPAA
jgi:DDE superfamily endonuclease/Archaeal putative transposase ISC1217